MAVAGALALGLLAFIFKDVVDAAARGDVTLLRRALVLAAATFLGGTPVLMAAYYVSSVTVKRTLTDLRVRVGVAQGGHLLFVDRLRGVHGGVHELQELLPELDAARTGFVAHGVEPTALVRVPTGSNDPCPEQGDV